MKLIIKGLIFLFYCTHLPFAGGTELVFVESALAGPNIIRIPFRLTGTLITIRARADSIEGNFFFDTGASGLVLNQRIFGNYPKIRRSSASTAGATGGVAIKGTLKIDSLSSANLKTFEVTADLVDLTHLERSKKLALAGLIGFEVFKDFEVLFDYEDQLLVLIRTTAKGAWLEELPKWEYQPMSSFPLIVQGHTALVELQFGSRSKKIFAIDSGAEQNLLSTASGKKFLEANFEILGRVKLKGAGNKQTEVLHGLLSNAMLDTLTFAPMNTMMANLTDINAVFDAELDGVLGYEFLSQYTMSINYRKRKLYFYKKIMP